MKKTNMLYWIFTALFAGLMLFSAIPDIMMVKDAVTMMHDQLGYEVWGMRKKMSRQNFKL